MPSKRWTVLPFLTSVVLLGAIATGYATESRPYPRSLEEEIKSLYAAGADESTDPVFLLRLAQLQLDAGDDLYTKQERRRVAYEEGARIAKKVLELQEDNARAHYLYAANLGSAAHLKGLTASALTVGTLKKHVRRSLELEPNFAPAVHMMGMLLERLPGILGGDATEALHYLKRAVELDPTYTHAPLNLAKAYLERGQSDAAEQELEMILSTKNPRNPYAFARHHRGEAERLLHDLKK